MSVMEVMWLIILVAEAALVLFIVLFAAPLAIFGWDRFSGWWYDVTDAVDTLLCCVFPKLRAPQLRPTCPACGRDLDLDWAIGPLNVIKSPDVATAARDGVPVCCAACSADPRVVADVALAYVRSASTATRTASPSMGAAK